MKEIVRAFRDAIPGLTVPHDDPVGFPGESEAAFQNLLEFLDEIRFDRLGVFTVLARGGDAPPAFPTRCRPRSRRSAPRWSRSRRTDSCGSGVAHSSAP